jgi:phosphoglycolate phosphatase
MFRAVVFDLDGTLLNTLDDLADSFNRVLQDKGLPTHPVEAYRNFIGGGAAKLVTRALPQEKRNDEFAADCLDAFRKEYSENWNNKTRPYDGVPELLDDLVSRQILLAVNTNKPQHFADLCVQAHFSAWDFAAVFGQRDGVPMKPDPAGPREIAQCMNVACEECLYVGDSDVDMRTAVGSKMFAVGAAWGFRPEQELRESGAAEIIGGPTDLLRFVG